MASRSSESVSFEPRDEENQRLREENAKLRRVLAAHGIPVAQFVPDDGRPVQTIAPAAMENKEERARKRIALFRSLLSVLEQAASLSEPFQSPLSFRVPWRSPTPIPASAKRDSVRRSALRLVPRVLPL